MTAVDVLERVLRAGGRVVAGEDGPRLRYPPDLRPLVLERRQELRELLSEATVDPQAPELGPLLAHVLSLRLDQFQFEGISLKLSVAGDADALWLAPDERHAAALTNIGINRGRVFTSRELAELLTIGTSNHKHRLVAFAKANLRAEIVGVWPPRDQATAHFD